MLIAAALILGGSIVYALVPDNSGALMIASGCALAPVIWLERMTRHGSPSPVGEGRGEGNLNR